MEQVSWNTVASFNGATGLRLPTEAEWEYACRAQMGTSVARTAFHNGNDDAQLGDIGWYFPTAGQTHAVGGKAGNALGLHDMHGNVFEWTKDWYGVYSSLPVTNPTGPTSGTWRVIRGGSWNNNSFYARASQRFYYVATFSYGVGFRAARNP